MKRFFLVFLCSLIIVLSGCQDLPHSNITNTYDENTDMSAGAENLPPPEASPPTLDSNDSNQANAPNSVPPEDSPSSPAIPPWGEPNDNVQQDNPGENNDGSGQLLEYVALPFDTYFLAQASFFSKAHPRVNTSNPPKIDTITFINEKAEANRSIKLFGVDYNLNYSLSATVGLSDLMLDSYSIDGIEGAYVFYDASTSKLVKCQNIPFAHNAITEQEYLSLICNTILPDRNISDYMHHSQKTRYTYSYVHETGVPIYGSQTVDGFHICDETQTLEHRYFYFAKGVNEYDYVTTREHIAVLVYDDKITWEIYDLDYEIAAFQNILTNFEKLEISIKQCLQKNVHSGFAISEMNISRHELVFQEGQPYVISTVDITIEDAKRQEVFYQVTAKLISVWLPFDLAP